MADPFNGRTKNPRVRVFVGMIVILGAVGLVVYHARWVRSVFQGPAPVTLATLEDLKDECFAILGIAAFTFLVGLWIIGLALSDMRKIRRMVLDSPGNRFPAGEALTENWDS